MQTTQPISLQKIIFLIIFICAALITSVFVSHMSQKPRVPKSENAMVFPAARDLNNFELITADQQKFSASNLLDHWTLLFFGFTNCAMVCPTTMDMLSKAYTELQPAFPNLQVVLISLDPNRDSSQSLLKYTHSYNPNFIGVTGKVQDLRKLQSQLGVYSARDTTEGTNYQIQHTASIMLINPKAQWAGVFKYGMQPKEFIQAFEQSVKSLSQQRV